jgi:alkanesulfonate monooxygenase SsuD/methylene tetrahydromethanopterin reductase-like flavin-dependent oxidoreductase (luciferase family)
MKVGIGLPNAVPETSDADLVEWARRAEAREFSTLGTIDRVAYDNYEPLIALAGAAAVTERIGLCTSVLIGPLRNATGLAKQCLSLNALAGGRFTLGIAVGGREDDYSASDVDFGSRGRALDAALERIEAVWGGGPTGPGLGRKPGLIVGGAADVSFDRAARFGDGWIAGGAPPDQFAGMAAKLDSAWSAAGREGSPRKLALAYFSLGDAAEENAKAYLEDYYAWLGAETAGFIAGSAAKDAETVKQYVGAFEEAGCDELILFPSSSDPAQVDLLADAISS